ncbi:class I SAM-dependent methyltransferase [Desulfotalea psychrophila]|nr:class I SAM-dependent methyltransferase [Desulfotalea psychrophila]
MPHNIQFYNDNAPKQAEIYQKISAQQANRAWQKYWPSRGERVLDVGAGCGRDARWYALGGCPVVAVEPAKKLLAIGSLYTKGLEVDWLEDSLPGLSRLDSRLHFDLIVLGAVWMHIPPQDRAKTYHRLTSLLTCTGRIVITLRHGPFNDQRTSHGVCASELIQLGQGKGMTCLHKTETSDLLGRGEVKWQTVVLGFAKNNT